MFRKELFNIMLKRIQEEFIINLFKIKKTKRKYSLISNKILPSITILLIFSIIIPVNADIESPKKQLKKGIVIEGIQCNVERELVIRNNEMPACVKSETVEKMKKRGMLSEPIKFTDLNNEIKEVETLSEPSKATSAFKSRSLLIEN